MSKRRVVITGMGAVTPLGITVETYWDGLLAGRSGIGPTTLFEIAGFDSRIAGECLDFDPAKYFDVKDIKRMDRFTQLGLVAAKEAASNSGLDFAKEDMYRVGVVMGTGIGGIMELESQHSRLLQKGPSKVSAFTIPRLMGNAAAAFISINFGTHGPSSTVVTACAAANSAMCDALRVIQRGDCDVMFTGGSEAAVTATAVSAFGAMHALSTRNDDPHHASRPFDRNRDGFVISEGAGVLIFEEYEHARKRGAQIYAEVMGCGMTADGNHITQPDPDGTAAARAMQLCLQDAGIQAEDLDYINAHGTSTPLGDVAETKAIKTVLSSHAAKTPVSSTKSCTGHLLGASGGIELIATALAIHHRTLPPTVNLETPDPECDLDYVPNVPRDKVVRRAMSNSFGFGGHNACLIVGAV